MLTACFVHCYSALTEAFSLVLLPAGLFLRGVRRWEVAERRRRAGPAGGPPPEPSVWLHAASLGESKLLCQFAGLLRSKRPSERYVVTAATRTGLDYLRAHHLPGMTVAGYLPVDTVGRMRAFLRHHAVRRVWLMETELWPSMLWACRREGVPVGVANARLEQRTVRRLRALGPLGSGLVSVVDIVLAQSTQYAARFTQVGVPPQRVRVAGNLKSAVAVRPLPPEVRASIRHGLGIGDRDVVLTAGCLHPGEGAAVAGAVAGLREQGIPCRCIVVPRHREAVGELVRELGDGAVTLADTRSTAPWDVCLIDRYGVLDDMYGIADVAFVGGTLVKVGGHSVWDAARYGIPVLFGPQHHTQQQGCDRLVAAGVGFVVDSGAAIAGTVQHVLGDGAEGFQRNRDRFAAALSETSSELVALLP